MLAILTTICLIIGSVTLAVVDRALGPENKGFPCAHPVMQWAIRIYALALFNRAALLTSMIWSGSDPHINFDAFLCSMAMATAHCVLLRLLMGQRMPSGIWDRLERRRAYLKSSFS